MTKMEQVLQELKKTPTAVWQTANWLSADVQGKSWTPVGVMVHHTAMSAPLSVRAAQIANRFNGPLCNFIVRKVRQVDLVCDGYAYDSGMGSAVVLNEVRQGIFPGGNAKARGLLNNDTNGNPWFIDIEVDHVGDGSSITAESYYALIDLIVSICMVYGFTDKQVIGHKEWTSRKVDPNWADDEREMDRIRQDVAARLTSRLLVTTPPQPTPPPAGSAGVFILSPPTVTIDQMTQFGARGTQRFKELAVVAYEESVKVGIDPAVTYAVMAHETGYGKFSAVVTPEFHNWGGIKTAQGGGNIDPNAHAKFETDRIGVRAVVQHLGLYAGLFFPPEEVVDPRHFDAVRGRVGVLPHPSWTWASSGEAWSHNVAAKVELMREYGS